MRAVGAKRKNLMLAHEVSEAVKNLANFGENIMKGIVELCKRRYVAIDNDGGQHEVHFLRFFGGNIEPVCLIDGRLQPTPEWKLVEVVE